MNVDEAMAKWKQLREHYCMPAFPQTMVDILAAEVERLRAEVEILAVEVTRLQAIEHEQIETQAELAAAKAASVCPVEVLNIFEGTYESDRYIELRTEAEADVFDGWLRDRMKDTTPPAT